MSASSLHEAIALEQSVLQEIEASRQRQLQFEQAALAELDQAYALAYQEAARCGLDLPTYAAALAEREAAEWAELEAAEYAEYHAAATDAEQQYARALASAKAAAAGTDLDTYTAALADPTAHACAHVLAEQEAAATGLDLETYVATLAELEAAEMAQLGALESDQANPYTAHALAEDEAAAAGMDLPSYVAALHGDEQAILEAIAYQQGLSLHQAELAAQHASWQG